MTIIDPSGKAAGKVTETGKPFYYEYKGKTIVAGSLAAACYKVCKELGKGYFYLLFTV